MSAERLRDAATRLREEARAVTPGPWASSVSDDRRWALVDAGEAIVSRSATDEDATYIATMHPPVALALADWLDDLADHDPSPLMPTEVGAFKVADAVLGGGQR